MRTPRPVAAAIRRPGTGGDHTLTRSGARCGADRWSVQRIAEGDGCLITDLTGWPSRARPPRVSHEVMQDVSTGVRLPTGIALGSGTPRVEVGVGAVSRAEVVAVARGGAAVGLAVEAESAIEASRAVVEALADDEVPHYGVSTGFGALANRHIPPGLRAELQRSLVRSHAAGSGAEVEREVVRAMLLLRLSTLATGRTGVRPGTARVYAALLDAGITPIVAEYGSPGGSGGPAALPPPA